MSADHPYRIRFHTVFGIIVILLGVLFTLDNLAVVDAHASLRYWPVIIIVLGGMIALQAEHRGGRVWGGVLAIIGAMMLLRRLDLIAFHFWDFWPLILVAVGASLLWRGGFRRRLAMDGASDEHIVNGVAVLGAYQRRIATQDFRGGEVTAVMGGAEVDLRQAGMREPSAVLHVVAFWGGVELRVPREWAVQVEGIPLLGGFEDKTLPPSGTTPPRLIVKGMAVMGGVEITN
jgi:predicted membrane protein